MKEKDIQNQILEGLQYYANHQTVAWRNNTGVAKYADRDGSNRFIRFGRNGSADITGICMGRRLDIEVKRPGCKQSASQKEFESLIKSNGGIYFVAESLDEALSKLHYEIRFMNKLGWSKIIEDLYENTVG